MSGIVLSSAVRSNLITLQTTAEQQAKVQERLSTGKKVNSALDNPTNFFTAGGLSRRANDLSALLDGMSQGIKSLEAADNAMRSITKTVESMQANIRQARQDKSFQGKTLTVDDVAIGNGNLKNLTFVGGAVGSTQINIGVNTTGSGSQTTVSTSGAYAAPSAAAQATYTAQAAYATPGATKAFTIAFNGGSVDATLTTAETTVAAAVTKINTVIAGDADSAGKFEAYDNGGKLGVRSIGNVDGNVAVTDTVAASGDAAAIFGTAVTAAGSDGQTNFTVNGKAVSLTTAQSSVALAVTKANADLGTDSAFEAFNDSGKLGVRAKSTGATALTIGGPDAGLFGSVTTGTAGTLAGVKSVDTLVGEINTNATLGGKVRASNDGGKLRIENLSTEALTIGGISSDGSKMDGSATTTSVGGNDIRKNLITQFNELRRQLDKLSDDSSYNGVNLLKADKLKLTFNEVGSSVLEIQAKDSKGVVRAINTDATSLDIGVATTDEFSNDALLEARYDALGTALTKLQTQSGSFGSSLSIVQIRQEFTHSMINTLEVGADNLTLADQNEEGANLLALNTRQQLSQTALSLASQAQQAVLRLFG
jgi:flagellin-like hook-associated protein FlgL